MCGNVYAFKCPLHSCLPVCERRQDDVQRRTAFCVWWSDEMTAEFRLAWELVREGVPQVCRPPTSEEERQKWQTFLLLQQLSLKTLEEGDERHSLIPPSSLSLCLISVSLSCPVWAFPVGTDPHRNHFFHSKVHTKKKAFLSIISYRFHKLWGSRDTTKLGFHTVDSLRIKDCPICDALNPSLMWMMCSVSQCLHEILIMKQFRKNSAINYYVLKMYCRLIIELFLRKFVLLRFFSMAYFM